MILNNSVARLHRFANARAFIHFALTLSVLS